MPLCIFSHQEKKLLGYVVQMGRQMKRDRTSTRFLLSFSLNVEYIQKNTCKKYRNY